MSRPLLTVCSSLSTVLSTHRHLAHPVPVPIPNPIEIKPREIRVQDLWSRNFDTEIIHCNAVGESINVMPYAIVLDSTSTTFTLQEKKTKGKERKKTAFHSSFAFLLSSVAFFFVFCFCEDSPIPPVERTAENNSAGPTITVFRPYSGAAEKRPEKNKQTEMQGKKKKARNATTLWFLALLLYRRYYSCAPRPKPLGHHVITSARRENGQS